MPEPRGRAARWQTALLLVPGAAVTFGAAVAWASGSTPTTNPPPSTPPQSALPDSAVHTANRAAHAQAAYRDRLEAQIREHGRRAEHLEHRLKQLRARTARLGQLSVALPGSAAPAVAAPGQNAAPVVVPAPPPVVAPAPPPPPVNTVTGASGHP